MKKLPIDELCIYTLRALSIDMINKAKSGHPGMALGSAAILHTLYSRHFNIEPSKSLWMNRDRFVLSAGHASALLYALIHVNGYKLSIEDLQNFRQLNSLTPGHPEYKHTDGVDATSGPLGQGIAQAVGMAMASEAIKAQYHEGHLLQDHYTYCLCGDGCLFEGVSQEAISFAGLQKLNKLILFYDANDITLDGPLTDSFNENVKERFHSANWNVIVVNDGNDVESIDKAIKKAKNSKDKPTVIIVHTIIGYGSAKEGTNKVHGSPLGDEDGLAAKRKYLHEMSEEARLLIANDLEITTPFHVNSEVYDYYHKCHKAHGKKKYKKEQKILINYRNNHLDDFVEYAELANLDVKRYLPNTRLSFIEGSSDSTRNTSQKVLNHMMQSVPHLMGGSADVAHSVMTMLQNGSDFTPDNRGGHNVNFGIREFGMACIQNGILLHGGLRTYVGSFLVFSDYMKSAIRHSSLSNLPSIYLFSHDSIAVGEDGPTHQPIEHLVMLRSIPNMSVIRPCDARETYGAWETALLSTKTPTALILSRQNLPLLPNSKVDNVARGGYVISPEKSVAKYIILASGSEVSLAVKVQEALLSKNIDVRVCSIPSIDLFEKQSREYQESVIGKEYQNRIAIEMLSPMSWYKYAPNVYGIDTFGASAKANDVINYYKFDVESLVSYIEKLQEE